MRSRCVALVVCCLTLGGAASASAHDFWIRPSTYAVAPGQALEVRLFVGHDRDVREFGRKPDRIVQFEAVGPRGRTPIRSATATVPAGRVEIGEPGVVALVYRSNHAYIELPPDKFEGYLEHEGLVEIVRERQRRGEARTPGRESYARYCKALVRAGQGNSGWNRTLGLPLEITPIDDVDPGSGAKVRLRVSFRGRPLPGALVEVFDLDDLRVAVSGRTRAKGEIELTLPGDGPWAAASTTMVRAEAPVKGDWESFWATLTFGPAAPASPSPQ